MQHTFDIPGPVSLLLEVWSGTAAVHAQEGATTTTVDVVGRDADAVTVEQRGRQVVVLAPRRWLGLLPDGDPLDVRVTVPAGTDLSAKVGSASVTVTGRLGGTTVRSGSGDVTLDAVDGRLVVDTGSGDTTVAEVRGDLKVRSGSGDIRVGVLDGSGSAATGSGDVRVDRASGRIRAKSGSGDLLVGDALGEVDLTTASGDAGVHVAHRGRVSANAVSGDVTVGVLGGVPVWTDVTSVSGSVRSTLLGAGRPAEGQDHVEVRARSVSGDVRLEQR